MLARTARWCFTRRWLVVVGWVVVLATLTLVARAAAGDFTTDYRIPGTESKAAAQLLEERFPVRSGDSIFVVLAADGGAADPAVQQRTEALLAELAEFDHVVRAVSPFGPEAGRNVSPDGRMAFGVLQLDVESSSMPVEVTRDLIRAAEAASGDGVRFELNGAAVQQAEFGEGSGAEALGILAAVVILLISFGSVLAMGLPILTAIVGIGISLAVLALVAHIANVPNFAPVIAAMIGIGVGIDYALFIVTRYRQNLADGLDAQAATLTAMTTAGRSVLFAGMTVVVSVFGILLMGLPFMQGVALGAAVAVLVAMAASVTLLPAMFGFAGENIDRLRVPFVSRAEKHHRAGLWFRWSRFIQRRPWPAFVAGSTIIVLLALPVFSLRLGFPGDESLPESRTSRRSYDLLVQGFGPGFSAPLVLAADLAGPGARSTLQALEERIRAEPGVAVVIPPDVNERGDAAVLTVLPTTSSQDEQTEDLVKRLRNDVIPDETEGTDVRVHVGGPTAGFIDLGQAISSRLPIFISVVVGLSFLLLLMVFRAVLVAFKAAIMNLLSIAAAYGFLVAVAQWGWLKDVFGIATTGPIASFIPMMMFAILFGLSMDYEVFLLSRTREEYDRTGDNGLAVADGLAATARVITAAAAVMVTVFLAFVLGPDVIIKEIGLGLASAIFIDATIIRMLLVPSTMELLGSANWWIPRWLDRILPRVSFETSVPATATVLTGSSREHAAAAESRRPLG